MVRQGRDAGREIRGGAGRHVSAPPHPLHASRPAVRQPPRRAARPAVLRGGRDDGPVRGALVASGSGTRRHRELEVRAAQARAAGRQVAGRLHSQSVPPLERRPRDLRVQRPYAPSARRSAQGSCAERHAARRGRRDASARGGGSPRIRPDEPEPQSHGRSRRVLCDAPPLLHLRGGGRRQLGASADGRTERPDDHAEQSLHRPHRRRRSLLSAGRRLRVHFHACAELRPLPLGALRAVVPALSRRPGGGRASLPTDASSTRAGTTWTASRRGMPDCG